jgi:hypothetical protein
MFTPSAQEEVKLSIRSSRYIILSCRLKMPQLTDREQDQIDTHVRCEHKPVPAIITKIKVARLKKGIETVDKSTVYHYVNGGTHRRQNVESRGRRPARQAGRPAAGRAASRPATFHKEKWPISLYQVCCRRRAGRPGRSGRPGRLERFSQTPKYWKFTTDAIPYTMRFLRIINLL